MNGSTKPLAKEAAFASAAQPLSYWDAAIKGSVFADKPGTLHIEQSPNGEHWDVDTSYAIEANKGKGFYEPACGEFWRIRYVNGSEAQGAFRIAAHAWGGV